MLEKISKMHEHSFTRHLVVGIVVLSFVTLLTIFSDHGLLALLKLELKRSNLEQEIQAELIRKDSINNYIIKLKSDTLQIEKIAREKYGMIRPKEQVFFIEELKSE